MHGGVPCGPGADLLLHGCDLAASQAGQDLATALGDLAGCDVAASTDTTGHAARGGDWELEFQQGSVDTMPLLGVSQQATWDDVLAATPVTNYLHDADPIGALDATAPTGGLVDADADGRPGITLAEGNAGYAETDTYRLWHTGSGGMLVGSNVSVGLYSAMFDFATDEQGGVTLYLTETDIDGSNPSATPIATATVQRTAGDWTGGGTFDYDLVDFGNDEFFVEPDRVLAVKLVVDDAVSDADMMFAFDSASTPASLAYTLLSSDAPVIGDLAGDTLAYTEGQAAQVIDQGVAATLTDLDSPNFDGGMLRVSIPVGVDSSEDVLSIRSAGLLSYAAGTVSYGGTAFGTVTGGSNGQPLHIVFGPTANQTTVAALLQNITYQNTDST